MFKVRGQYCVKGVGADLFFLLMHAGVRGEPEETPPDRDYPTEKQGEVVGIFEELP